MGFGDGFFGKIIVQAIAGVLASILGMIIILGIIYLFAVYGVIPMLQDKLSLPNWFVDLIDKLL